jgi:type I restriction enzyme S subunit
MKPLAEIARTRSGGTPSRRRHEYFGGSIPWVKSGELGDGSVKATDEMITDLGLRESSAEVFPAGTLLIALYGATVGRLGVLEIDAATNQAVCAIMPHDAAMTPFLWHVFRAMRSRLVAAAQGGAQPNISQAIVRGLLVPVPPPDERDRLVAEIEQQLSLIDSLGSAVHSALKRSGALRQAILGCAFRGELVPQDPDDEPASVALERIRAERAAAPKPTHRKRVPA